MANENLVSNVQYKGQVIGSATLVIEDTSTLPTYTLNVYDMENRANINPSNLLQLGQYRFELNSTIGKVSGYDKVYVRQTCTDGKLNTDSNVTPIFRVLTKDFEVNIDPTTGSTFHTYRSIFFPSLLGYSGKIEFFHDTARTELITSVNVSIQALSSAQLLITNEANWDNPAADNTLMAGDNIFVGVKATGNIGQRPNILTHSAYSGTIGSSAIADGNPWLHPPVYQEMYISKATTISGRVQLNTKENPNQSLEPSIFVQMGELSNTIELKTLAYHGTAFDVTTDRAITSMFGNPTYLASRYPVEVANAGTKVWGAIWNGWTSFGRYYALLNEIRVTNLAGVYGFLDLDFTKADQVTKDTTTEKPGTIYLTIRGRTKIRMVRDTTKSLTGNLQRYNAPDGEDRRMLDEMAQDGGKGRTTYLVTLV